MNAFYNRLVNSTLRSCLPLITVGYGNMTKHFGPFCSYQDARHQYRDLNLPDLRVLPLLLRNTPINLPRTAAAIVTIVLDSL